MKLRASATREEPELNIVSLIDVILMLLIFFMLTTTFVRPSQLAVRLPQAGGGSEPAAGDAGLEISVTSQGEYRVNGRSLVDNRPQTLEAAMRKVMADRPERRLTLSADGRATHQSVVTAMDIAGRLGFAEIRITTVKAAPLD